jgi:4a-hydroxytetrahydrobiopterin dehydratase
MLSDLISQKCEACTIDAPKVTKEESLELLKTLDNWVILNEGFDYLEKIFTFDNYEKAVAFSNDVAALAKIEDHHPLIVLEWGKVKVKWWSHKINGLHKNDFICAAKTDLLAK